MNCLDCGCELIPRLRNRVVLSEQRARGVKSHEARGLCGRCYERHRRRGALDLYDRQVRPMVVTLGEIDFMRSQGLDMRQTAKRLGVTLDAVQALLRRAKKRGMA